MLQGPPLSEIDQFDLALFFGGSESSITGFSVKQEERGAGCRPLGR